MCIDEKLMNSNIFNYAKENEYTMRVYGFILKILSFLEMDQMASNSFRSEEFYLNKVIPETALTHLV